MTCCLPLSFALFLLFVHQTFSWHLLSSVYSCEVLVFLSRRLHSCKVEQYKLFLENEEQKLILFKVMGPWCPPSSLVK